MSRRVTRINPLTGQTSSVPLTTEQSKNFIDVIAVYSEISLITTFQVDDEMMTEQVRQSAIHAFSKDHPSIASRTDKLNSAIYPFVNRPVTIRQCKTLNGGEDPIVLLMPARRSPICENMADQAARLLSAEVSFENLKIKPSQKIPVAMSENDPAGVEMQPPAIPPPFPKDKREDTTAIAAWYDEMRIWMASIRKEIHDRNEENMNFKKAVEKRDEDIEDFKKTIKKRDEDSKKRDEDIEDFKNTIKKRDEDIEDFKKAIKKRDEDIAKRNADIDRLIAEQEAEREFSARIWLTRLVDYYFLHHLKVCPADYLSSTDKKKPSLGALMKAVAEDRALRSSFDESLHKAGSVVNSAEIEIIHADIRLKRNDLLHGNAQPDIERVLTSLKHLKNKQVSFLMERLVNAIYCNDS